jgi:hypothetical protein
MRSEDVSEHMAKLYRIAEGAQRACEREHRPEQSAAGKKWWDGYRQALDDISDFFGIPPAPPPADPPEDHPQ